MIGSWIQGFGAICQLCRHKQDLGLGLGVVMTLGLGLGVVMTLVSIQDQELYIGLEKTAVENVENILLVGIFCVLQKIFSTLRGFWWSKGPMEWFSQYGCVYVQLND